MRREPPFAELPGPDNLAAYIHGDFQEHGLHRDPAEAHVVQKALQGLNEVVCSSDPTGENQDGGPHF